MRGIEKPSLFLDDKEGEEFLSPFPLLLAGPGTDGYADMLLDAHSPLLLPPQSIRPSDAFGLMRHRRAGHALVFNLRHPRRQLFRDRYKSTVCNGAAYRPELVR